MSESILVLNAGSSSVKFSLFATQRHRDPSVRLHGQVEPIGPSATLAIADAAGRTLADSTVNAGDHDTAIATIHDWLAAHGGDDALAAVGHRVVHGGTLHTQPVLIDASVIEDLESLVPLAPLHQPHQIAAIRAVATVAPRVPQVACFDTAFHAEQPSLARAFALPAELERAGVRRYGFHGLSYEYIVSTLPGVAPACADGNVVVAHLGNGASMCAIAGGRSVATTMGLTPLDGLPMGTRCGTLDPGALLYLLGDRALDAAELQRILYEQSGLLGVSGISGDMRTLLASDARSAQHAIDLFVYRIGRELGSLAAALGGLDALIFTGGIGENAAPIRARVCHDARWLGLTLDEDANSRNGPRISREDARVSAWVIRTDENRMVARHVRRVLDAGEAL